MMSDFAENALSIERFNKVSFDDVLLEPRYTEVRSRLDANLISNLGTIPLSVPIISSPMDTVTGSKMAIDIGLLGGAGVIHRFMSVGEQIHSIRLLSEARQNSGKDIPIIPAVGVGGSGIKWVKSIMSEFGNEIDMLSVDVANGHSIVMKEMMEFITSRYSVEIMAGNVATGSGFRFLADLGASSVRVGIGGGSACVTRIQTGFGVPTLSSVIDAGQVKDSDKKYEDVSIIADGGIRYSSDAVKSFVAGANQVMCGRLLAGTSSSPNIVISVDGRDMVCYRGMASEEAQRDKRGGLKNGTCAEGVSLNIPFSGELSDVIDKFLGGIRSGMSYGNAKCLSDLSISNMIRVSGNSLNESHTSNGFGG